jgi:hypothetical protein
LLPYSPSWNGNRLKTQVRNDQNTKNETNTNIAVKTIPDRKALAAGGIDNQTSPRL